MKKVGLLLLVTLLAAWQPEAVAKPMSLQEVMRLAASNPRVQQAEAQAKAVGAVATLHRRSALMPTLSVSGSGTLRDRSFTLETPMGILPLGDTTSLAAQVRISQPLFDAPTLWYSAVAAKHDHRAAQLTSKQRSEEMSAEAASYYFDILVAQAQMRANRGYHASLQSRHQEVRAMIEAERAVEADALRIALAVQNADQDHLILVERSQVTKYALGRSLGLDEPVEPTALPTQSLFTAKVDSLDIAQRNDLRALEQRKKAARRRLGGIGAEVWPKVVLQGDLVYSDAGPQSETMFASASVNFVWVPFAAGTRQARKTAGDAELLALTHQIDDARRGAALQIQQGQAAQRIARGYMQLADKAIVQSTEAARVTLSRYQSGRDTVNDLIAAESLVRDSISQRDQAQIEALRAEVMLKLASGQALNTAVN